MTFVFCSLLELAWVGYLSRPTEDSGKKEPPKEPESGPTNIVAPIKSLGSPKMARPPPQYEDTSGGFTNLLQRYEYLGI